MSFLTGVCVGSSFLEASNLAEACWTLQVLKRDGSKCVVEFEFEGVTGPSEGGGLSGSADAQAVRP